MCCENHIRADLTGDVAENLKLLLFRSITSRNPFAMFFRLKFLSIHATNGTIFYGPLCRERERHKLFHAQMTTACLDACYEHRRKMLCI